MRAGRKMNRDYTSQGHVGPRSMLFKFVVLKKEMVLSTANSMYETQLYKNFGRKVG